MYGQGGGHDRNADKVEIAGTILHRTDVAVKFSDGDSTVWLPLHLVEIDEAGPQKGTVTITMPEWLAIDRGLA